MKTVSVEHAKAINDAQHALTTVSLAMTTGQDELWGALGAAIAAVERCSRIAMRYVDRTKPRGQRPPEPPIRVVKEGTQPKRKRR